MRNLTLEKQTALRHTISSLSLNIRTYVPVTSNDSFFGGFFKSHEACEQKKKKTPATEKLMNCPSYDHFPAIHAFMFSRAEIDNDALPVRNGTRILPRPELFPAVSFQLRSWGYATGTACTLGITPRLKNVPSDGLSTIFRDHPKSTSPPGYQFLGSETLSLRGSVRRLARYFLHA